MREHKGNISGHLVFVEIQFHVGPFAAGILIDHSRQKLLAIFSKQVEDLQESIKGAITMEQIVNEVGRDALGSCLSST